MLFVALAALRPCPVDDAVNRNGVRSSGAASSSSCGSSGRARRWWAFFFGFHAGREEPWGSLTCGRLREMAETVQAKIKEGKEGDDTGGGLQFQKLTHGYWRQYIRREVLRAGGMRDREARGQTE